MVEGREHGAAGRSRVRGVWRRRWRLVLDEWPPRRESMGRTWWDWFTDLSKFISGEVAWAIWRV